MEITVYSKDKCGKCEAAKDKLQKMGLTYTTKDLQEASEVHEGWREDGTINLMAAMLLLTPTGDPADALPTIQINKEYFDYPQAMRELKRRKKK